MVTVGGLDGGAGLGVRLRGHARSVSARGGRRYRRPVWWSAAAPRQVVRRPVVAVRRPALTACCPLDRMLSSIRRGGVMSDRQARPSRRLRHPRRLGDRPRHGLARPHRPRDPDRRPHRRPCAVSGACASGPTCALDALRPEDSSLLILPGADLWDTADDLAPFARTARAFLDAGVPVAAICGATAGLAREGLLDDRDHTSAISFYLAATGYAGGGRYVEADAVTDGGLITAGPHRARRLRPGDPPAPRGLRGGGAGRLVPAVPRLRPGGESLRAVLERGRPRSEPGAAGPVQPQRARGGSGSTASSSPSRRSWPGPPGSPPPGGRCSARCSVSRCRSPASPARWASPGRASSASPTAGGARAGRSTGRTPPTAGPSSSRRPTRGVPRSGGSTRGTRRSPTGWPRRSGRRNSPKPYGCSNGCQRCWTSS